MTTDSRFKLERRGEVPERNEEKTDFYRATLELFNREGLPFLVGGTHAYYRYTGIARETKDFDLFVRRGDYPRFEAAVRAAGYQTELKFPHWLGKIYKDKAFIDMIFSGGNGEAAVDEEWFEHSVEGKIFGVPVRLASPEDMIWSKSYVMERERYDGGDVMHLFLRTGTRLDWNRLVQRFGDHWRLLLMQIVKFGFVYPSERYRVPREVTEELMKRFNAELNDRSSQEKVCYGTLTSRAQYLVDIREWGFADARVQPYGTMAPEDVEHWTEAIERG
ncbi:MAG: nucleotidyltransferase family protein [Acidobacteriota bacterium]|nr:nucleotidyltransferase family protein [Acidobacteriota bacterium]